jgi:hypothetical protein
VAALREHETLPGNVEMKELLAAPFSVSAILFF